jgi:hypothetical protein
MWVNRTGPRQMISLNDFKAKILGPLLRGQAPGVDAEFILFAAELDQPLAYLFETNRYDEVSGAAQRLANAANRLRATLAKDGYSPDDLLHLDAGSVLALVHDEATAERWVEALERAVAHETDLVTVSTLIQPITTQQLVGGLYRAPRVVVGVPGVNDYQERINRYYGLDSPSTVPRDDSISQRRHFGEVVALARSLMIRAHESRQIVPFYEALPFAVRCASCQTRPAERLDRNNCPVCGVCLRKRHESSAAPLDHPALLWLEAVGLDRLLEQQRTVGAYRRVYHEIGEVLDVAVPGRTGALNLAASGGFLLLALPAESALEAATEALEAIALHYNLRPPLPFVAAVAIGRQPDQFRALNNLIQQIASSLRRAAESDRCVLDVQVMEPTTAFDRFRRPYTVDEARRLNAGITILRNEAIPIGAFADLPEQAARGNAGLYYTFERSNLSGSAQVALGRLERAWDIGSAPGPRFFAMLTDALALARVLD